MQSRREISGRERQPGQRTAEDITMIVVQVGNIVKRIHAILDKTRRAQRKGE